MKRSIHGVICSFLLFGFVSVSAAPVRGPIEFQFDEKKLISKAKEVLSTMKEFRPERYDLSRPFVASITGKGCEGEPVHWMIVVFAGRQGGSANAQCFSEKSGEWVCGCGVSVEEARENLRSTITEYRDMRNGDGCEP